MICLKEDLLDTIFTYIHFVFSDYVSSVFKLQAVKFKISLINTNKLYQFPVQHQFLACHANEFPFCPVLTLFGSRYHPKKQSLTDFLYACSFICCGRGITGRS